LLGIEEQFRAARSDPDLAVLEGFHALKHAIRFGAELVALVGTDADASGRLAEVLAPDLRGRLADGLRVVSPETFAKLAPQPPPTGLIGIAHRPRVDLHRVLSSRQPRPVVLLEDPHNLGNVGACIRVAAAAGAEAVLTTGAQDPWHPAVLRGAAGLHFALPVLRITEPRLEDRSLIAVHPEGDLFDPARIPSRAVLAFGSERYGIGEELLARADHQVSIPMRPGVSSLNLATSVAAVLFGWRLTARASPHKM
jgi:RNA methyltransferase, TrmH family